MTMQPAIILAGGRASRMGGGHKPLLKLGNRPMIDHVIRRASGQFDPVALNVNGDATPFEGFGMPILCDTVSDLPGPLAGVLVGMEWAARLGARTVVSLAGDTPFFPLDLAPRLASAAAGDSPVMAATRLQDGEIVCHPTFALWPVALRDDLRDWLASGERRVRGFAARHGMVQVAWDEGGFDPFFNVNTPGDLSRAQELVGTG